MILTVMIFMDTSNLCHMTHQTISACCFKMLFRIIQFTLASNFLNYGSNFFNFWQLLTISESNFDSIYQGQPFWPQSPIASAHGQLPHHGVNASGVIMVAGSSQTTSQRSLVNIVNTPCSVQSSNVVFSVSINAISLTHGYSGKPPLMSA